LDDLGLAALAVVDEGGGVAGGVGEGFYLAVGSSAAETGEALAAGVDEQRCGAVLFTNALMAIPNLIGILLLSAAVAKTTKEYFSRSHSSFQDDSTQSSGLSL
jgi:hypothetical protein